MKCQEGSDRSKRGILSDGIAESRSVLVELNIARLSHLLCRVFNDDLAELADEIKQLDAIKHYNTALGLYGSLMLHNAHEIVQSGLVEVSLDALHPPTKAG